MADPVSPTPGPLPTRVDTPAAAVDAEPSPLETTGSSDGGSVGGVEIEVSTTMNTSTNVPPVPHGAVEGVSSTSFTGVNVCTPELSTTPRVTNHPRADPECDGPDPALWSLADYFFDHAPRTRELYSNTDGALRPGWPRVGLALGDASLRSIGQVVFLDNPWSGLGLLLGLLMQDALSAGTSLLAVVGCNAICLALPQWVPRSDVLQGLYGYNACLVALAMSHFGFSDNKALWVCGVIVAVLASLLVVAAFRGTTERAAFTFTFPFNIAVIWYIIGARSTQLPGIQTATAPVVPMFPKATVGGEATLTSLILSLPANFGQVYFVDYWLAGLLMWLSCLFCSRKQAYFAFLGSVTGTLWAWALGVPMSDIRAGLWGFNNVLNAMLVCATQTSPTRHEAGEGRISRAVSENVRASFIAIALSMACAHTTAVTRAVLATWSNTPAFTLPFCITAVPYVFVVTAFRRREKESPPPSAGSQNLNSPHPRIFAPDLLSHSSFGGFSRTDTIGDLSRTATENCLIGSPPRRKR
eukprot:Hpha_TRINITY_DN30991_c0_g1::TRINITY_DN30991_c0_g1_i1::g.112302::m.112302/K08716/SLC14A; solute carrier family 14 (urea transporter)